MIDDRTHMIGAIKILVSLLCLVVSGGCSSPSKSGDEDGTKVDQPTEPARLGAPWSSAATAMIAYSVSNSTFASLAPICRSSAMACLFFPRGDALPDSQKPTEAVETLSSFAIWACDSFRRRRWLLMDLGLIRKALSGAASAWGRELAPEVSLESLDTVFSRPST